MIKVKCILLEKTNRYNNYADTREAYTKEYADKKLNKMKGNK